MKKFLAILLLIGIMLCTFAGCTSKDDPGTEINVYMGMADTFDPAMAYLDQDASNLLSLIYQGLFTVDAKGNLQKAMCKKYKVKGNVIEFTLNNTCWSDGTQVVAEDYVFAWKRLLDPEFQSEAASLLYYVENAIEVKNGDKYLDDVKIFAEGSIIHVELIDASYVDQFLYNCASVALFPLREDVISKLTLDEPFYDNAIDPVTKEPILAANKYLTSYSWATISAITVSCGPFYTKKIDLYQLLLNATNISTETPATRETMRSANTLILSESIYILCLRKTHTLHIMPEQRWISMIYRTFLIQICRLRRDQLPIR